MLFERNASVRTKRISVFAAAALIVGCLAVPFTAEAQTATSAKPTVVLVHGAWADASSWDGVITQLKTDGYAVVAPPNPLRGLTSDATSIDAFLKSIPGPVVLVGHSYGGSVVSVAAPSAPNVKALVYVDAFVPDGGDSCLSLLADPSSPPAPKDLFSPVPFATASGGDADVYFNTKYFGAVFASGLAASTASDMAATQRPITFSALNEKAPAAEGWKTLPSWYVLGDADMVIPPAREMAMAKRANAHIMHVNGGHTSMISHPEVTVAAIVAAANAVAK
jgi:pimeloyl-ACP methyl ester carboxylesterase